MSFLTFRYMLTPVLIQVFFWAGTLMCLMLGGISLIQGMRSFSSDDNFGVSRIAGFAFFVNGLMLLLLGPVVLRIGCELAIVYFRIHDELRDMHITFRRKL